jgi:hypothetical protein
LKATVFILFIVIDTLRLSDVINLHEQIGIIDFFWLLNKLLAVRDYFKFF